MVVRLTGDPVKSSISFIYGDDASARAETVRRARRIQNSSKLALLSVDRTANSSL